MIGLNLYIKMIKRWQKNIKAIFNVRPEPLGWVWPRPGSWLPQTALFPEQALATGSWKALHVCWLFIMSCSRVWVETTQGSGMPWCLWWGRKRSWTLEILGRRRTLHHLYSSTEPTSRSVWCSGWRRLSSSLASTSDLSVAKGFLTHDKTNSYLQLSSCILLNPSPGTFFSPCSMPGSSTPPSSPSWGEEQGSPHRCCQSDTGPLL